MFFRLLVPAQVGQLHRQPRVDAISVGEPIERILVTSSTERLSNPASWNWSAFSARWTAWTGRANVRLLLVAPRGADFREFSVGAQAVTRRLFPVRRVNRDGLSSNLFCLLEPLVSSQPVGFPDERALLKRVTREQGIQLRRSQVASSSDSSSSYRRSQPGVWSKSAPSTLRACSAFPRFREGSCRGLEADWHRYPLAARVRVVIVRPSVPRVQAGQIRRAPIAGLLKYLQHIAITPGLIIELDQRRPNS